MCGGAWGTLRDGQKTTLSSLLRWNSQTVINLSDRTSWHTRSACHGRHYDRGVGTETQRGLSFREEQRERPKNNNTEGQKIRKFTFKMTVFLWKPKK